MLIATHHYRLVLKCSVIKKIKYYGSNTLKQCNESFTADLTTKTKILEMETLLEDYKRRLETLNATIGNTGNNGSINDENKIVRLRTKAGCYRTIIAELEQVLDKAGYLLQKVLDDNYNTKKSWELKPETRDEIEQFLGIKRKVNEAKINTNGWLLIKNINDLHRGDTVMHISGGMSFLVDAVYGGRATVMGTKDITNSSEWLMLPACR